LRDARRITTFGAVVRANGEKVSAADVRDWVHRGVEQLCPAAATALRGMLPARRRSGVLSVVASSHRRAGELPPGAAAMAAAFQSSFDPHAAPCLCFALLAPYSTPCSEHAPF
jgi:hypothetical protein